MRSKSDSVLLFPMSGCFTYLLFSFSVTKITSERFNVCRKIEFLDDISVISIAEAVLLL